MSEASHPEDIVVKIQIDDENDSFDLFSRYSQNLQIIYNALQRVQEQYIWTDMDQETLEGEVYEFENRLWNEEVNDEDIDYIISRMAETGFLREVMMHRDYYSTQKEYQQPLKIESLSKNNPAELVLLGGFGLLTAVTTLAGYLVMRLDDEEREEGVAIQEISDPNETVVRGERLTGGTISDSDDD